MPVALGLSEVVRQHMCVSYFECASAEQIAGFQSPPGRWHFPEPTRTGEANRTVATSRAHQDSVSFESPPGRWHPPEPTRTITSSRARQDGGTIQSPPRRWHLREPTRTVVLCHMEAKLERDLDGRWRIELLSTFQKSLQNSNPSRQNSIWRKDG